MATKVKFPYEIVPLETELNKKILEFWPGERNGFVQVGPKKYFFPIKYASEAEHFYNFEVREDDIWIVTFPRSGTTWTQEMVWLIANDSDYQTAAAVPLTERSPFFEFSMVIHDELKEELKKENSLFPERMKMIDDIATPGWKVLSNYEGRRIIKTHFPLSLLPPNLLTAGCKVVYVARNPKDVSCSFYHLNQMFRTQGFIGDFTKFWGSFEGNIRTTWTQEMAWLIANNLDYKTAAEVPITERSPFFEFSIFIHDKLKEELKKENSLFPERMKMIDDIATPGWKVLSNYEGSRIIKTHFPFSLLPPNLLTAGCKVLYVARNPKDVSCSFYHLNQMFRTHGFIGSFTKFWYTFERSFQTWTPYWEHIKEGWELKNEKNLLFMFYEEINKDLPAAIRKVATFLGKPLTEEDVNTLQSHLSLENFRLNTSVNINTMKELGFIVPNKQTFVSKGQNGSWKTMFDENLNKRADKWIEDNLKDTDIKFPS